VKPNFTVANESEISTAPKVDFGNGVAPQARQGAQTPPPPTGPEANTPPPARAQ
jgi:hypothetical protein